MPDSASLSLGSLIVVPHLHLEHRLLFHGGPHSLKSGLVHGTQGWCPLSAGVSLSCYNLPCRFLDTVLEVQILGWNALGTQTLFMSLETQRLQTAVQIRLVL